MMIRLLVLFLITLQVSCSSVSKRLHERKQRESLNSPTSSVSQSDEQWVSGQIKSYERVLSTQREKEHYSKLLPWFRNQKERLEYLSLPNIDAKQEWALDKRVWTRSQTPTREMQEIIKSGDIAIGMPMDYVRKSWGEPLLREISGNPLFKNERWRYSRSVSTQDGHRTEKRIIFFEGGRVVGWETE